MRSINLEFQEVGGGDTLGFGGGAGAVGGF